MARASVLAGLGALVAGAVGWRAWSTEPRAAVEARQALANGRYDDASRVLTEWLAAAPDAPIAHFLKGRVAVAMGRLPEAVGEHAQAQTLGLPPGDLALLRALIASKTGRHAEAEPTLSQAFAEALVPDRQIDEALAKTYIETFDFKRAERVLDRWTRDFPADPKPYLWRAEVDGRSDSEPGAVEIDYREALRRDASLAKARLGLAEELRLTHRTGEAAREFEVYLATHPDDAEAHLGAGRNLMEQGDETAAAIHLNRAIALDPRNAEPLKELAAAATRHDDWEAAMNLLDRAIALDPFDVTVRHSRGLTLAHLGRADEARAEQAVAARLRTDLDRLNAARLRLNTSPHDRQSQLDVAKWMFDHAHEQEGARWAEKILSERPGDADASRLLAGYHERRGETGLANFYRLQGSPTPDPPEADQAGDRR
jgi:tetratricopeptide (TPR) repeat protein